MSIWTRINDLPKRSKQLLAGALALSLALASIWAVSAVRTGPDDAPRGQAHEPGMVDMPGMGMDGMAMGGDAPGTGTPKR